MKEEKEVTRTQEEREKRGALKCKDKKVLWRKGREETSGQERSGNRSRGEEQ